MRDARGSFRQHSAILQSHSYW